MQISHSAKTAVIITKPVENPLIAISHMDYEKDRMVVHLVAEGNDNVVITLDADEAEAMFDAIIKEKPYSVSPEGSDAEFSVTFGYFDDDSGKEPTFDLALMILDETGDGVDLDLNIPRNSGGNEQLIGVLEHCFTTQRAITRIMTDSKRAP